VGLLLRRGYIRNSEILISIGRKFRNRAHPFERENSNIETFEEWEYRKAKGTLSYFSNQIDLENAFREANILDIGCGGGGKTAYIAKNYKVEKIYGIDLSTDFIQKAQEFSKSLDLKNIEFLVCNAENLPFPDESLDFAIMFDTFEHLKNPESVLKEIKRVLKVGGEVLISFPPYYHPYGAHMNDLIPLPWIHLFFDESSIAEAYWVLSFLRSDGEMRRNLKISKANNSKFIISYINKMTIRKCKSILKAVDLRLKYFKLIPLRKFFYPLYGIKIFDELITRNCVILLKKED